MLVCFILMAIPVCTMDRYNILLNAYPFHIVGRYMLGICQLGLNMNAAADQSFKECVAWMQKNDEAQRLYDVYGEQMPRLKDYF